MKKKQKREKTPQKFTHEEWVRSCKYEGYIDKISKNLRETLIALSIITLKDKFDFTDDMLIRFRKECDNVISDMAKGYFNEQDLVDAMFEEAGIRG